MWCMSCRASLRVFDVWGKQWLLTPSPHDTTFVCHARHTTTGVIHKLGCEDGWTALCCFSVLGQCVHLGGCSLEQCILSLCPRVASLQVGPVEFPELQLFGACLELWLVACSKISWYSLTGCLGFQMKQLYMVLILYLSPQYCWHEDICLNSWDSSMTYVFQILLAVPQSYILMLSAAS